MSHPAKPFLDVLKGQKADFLPFWLMRQAGRYLPEYRALRATKKGFMDMAMDPAAACEITMQPIRRFGMDAAIIFSDILVVPYALGQKLDFVHGEGPKLDALNEIKDLSSLSVDHFHQKLSPVYEALRLTRAALSSEGYKRTALIGFAGAPWTITTYMIEGGGSKDFGRVKSWGYKDPESFSRLIDLITDVTIEYLSCQIEAGAEAVQVFDSWAGALDHAQFRKWSIEPMTKIVAALQKRHSDIPIIGFPKGAGLGIPSYARETGIRVLGLDSQIDPAWAAANIPGEIVLQGNLDPMALLAGGAALKNEAMNIISSFAHRPHIFNLGHGVNKDTPVEHVEDLVKIIKGFRPA